MYEDAGKMALGMVCEHPGEYGIRSLARNLRTSFLNEGKGDMGDVYARSVIDRLVETGRIIRKPRDRAWTSLFNYLHPSEKTASEGHGRASSFHMPLLESHGFSYTLRPGSVLAILMKETE